MALQNSSIETMNTFLSRCYFIPNYQREYSWESNELEDFGDDLEAARLDSDESNHFFWTGSKSAKETIRYILRKIHCSIDTTTELNLDNSQVHIEHIMPEDSSQWSISEEDRILEI